MARRILIANRGEIAVRIVQSLKEFGWESVAVYSEADARAVHVRAADFSVCVGPPKALESYLNQDRLIEAARETGADGIHPGYGFLAENAKFAQKVLDAGLVWVGPKPENIEFMGDKLAARRKVAAAGVPITPGSDGPVNLEQGLALAKKIGYPLLIKAAAGGGGKGMRVVRTDGEMKEALEGASRESASAFSDSRVYIEKYMENPRHIEFQILADKAGKTLHMYERECSVQRRYQKIIEETPSMALDDKLRGERSHAAVEAARYENAGTVEFLFSEGRFYFLEMNTRIQVEHPVTEMTTGIDLVKWQMRIAFGEPLSLRQEDIRPRGHAIECRIYAEDPLKNFLPSPGRILLVREPSFPWLRIDSGIESGTEVPPFYDPILSKVITWGADRTAARERMLRALHDYVVLGVATPIPFLVDILNFPDFVKGKYTTHLIGDHFSGWAPTASKQEQALAFSLAAALFGSGDGKGMRSAGTQQSGMGGIPPAWESIGPFRHGEGR
jgi:acetyl-CoA carboxylase biotin carboxylase subunit